MRAGDFNGDGKPDLLGTARDTNLVLWYENPGDPRKQPWKRHVLDAQSLQPCHGMPVDLDGDGDLDVVMALGMILGKGDNTRQIVWYENVGQPGKGTEWKKHIIGSNFDFAFEAIAVDLNGDGKLDVAATSWATPHGRVVWFETPESFEATVSNVIFLGGDTDTLAAMAGALSGAFLGAGRLPHRLVGLLESSPKGRAYLHQLAGQLFAVYQRGLGAAAARSDI